MPFFTATLTYRASQTDRPTAIPIVERIVLVEATDRGAARLLAHDIGATSRLTDEAFTRALNEPDQPATFSFVGVRKVQDCYRLTTSGGIESLTAAPAHGDDLGYLVTEVLAESDVTKLVGRTEPVRAQYDW